MPRIPEYGPDLALVWETFWAIRNSYDGSRAIPIHGIRAGLEILGLLEEALWITPLVLGMDHEFAKCIHKSRPGE